MGMMRSGIFVLLLVGAAVRPASADWLLTPYLGVVFAGDANTIGIRGLADTFEPRINFGGSVAWLAAGAFGFEVDFGVAPNFYQMAGDDDDFAFLDLESGIQTLMANLVFGVPIGGTSGPGLRPYVSGGVGLMRSRLASDADLLEFRSNDLGLNVGGGVHGFFTDNVGLRGDVRYFRGLELEEEDPFDHGAFSEEGFGLGGFDYWRATLGITFRFGG